MSWDTAVMMSPIATAVIFAYFAINMDRQNMLVKVLFMFMSILELYIAAGMAGVIADANTASANLQLMPHSSMLLIGGVFIFALFLMNLNMLINAAKAMFGKKVEEEDYGITTTKDQF